MLVPFGQVFNKHHIRLRQKNIAFGVLSWLGFNTLLQFFEEHFLFFNQFLSPFEFLGIGFIFTLASSLVNNAF
jgi:hypothetical protein